MPEKYSEIAYGLFDIGLAGKASLALKTANQSHNIIKFNALKTSGQIKPTDMRVTVENISLNRRNVVELKEVKDGALKLDKIAEKETTRQIIKNSDNLHEVKIDLTPLEGQSRLNTPDLGGSGKLKPAEAASAAQLESSLGKMERYTPPKGAISGTSPDFVITSGPNQGKTVDAMYTTDKLLQKEIDGLNKFYEKNMSTGSGKIVIQDHLKKADFVPVDFRVLTSSNQKIFMDYIKILPKEQQDKIIIMR